MADQNEEKKDSAAGKADIDLNKILLPKKGPSLDSAQRINAGALLEQEQKAGAEGLPKSAPQPVPEIKKEESSVKPLQTYQGDISSLVEKRNVSVVSIAAAEADRRGQAQGAAAAPPLQQKQEERSVLSRAALIGGGVLLLAGALGLIVYLATRPSTVQVTPLATAAPFINVDDTTQVNIAQGASRTSVMQALESARKAVKLSLGLMERLQLTSSGFDSQGNSTLTEVPIQNLFNTIAPYAPATLVRTLSGKYLLGVHSYDENDAFFILSTDSYETAYAGMLQWETTMQGDLSPLFVRTPPVHINNTPTPVDPTAGGSTTSTAPADYFGLPAQAGASASTTSAPVYTSIVPTAFVDRVVENHDARVIENKYGDILLLWTFINRNTIVITNNDSTLREVISRITQAPLQALPQ